MFWYNYGFYEESPNEDAIELTEEEYNALMTKIGNGGELKQDDEGRPYVEDTEVMQERLKQNRIAELIHNLEDTDYITNKLEEANVYFQITGDKTKLLSMYEEYKDLLTQREAWRAEIRELEKEVS